MSNAAGLSISLEMCNCPYSPAHANVYVGDKFAGPAFSQNGLAMLTMAAVKQKLITFKEAIDFGPIVLNSGLELTGSYDGYSSEDSLFMSCEKTRFEVRLVDGQEWPMAGILYVRPNHSSMPFPWKVPAAQMIIKLLERRVLDQRTADEPCSQVALSGLPDCPNGETAQRWTQQQLAKGLENSFYHRHLKHSLAGGSLNPIPRVF